MGETNSKGPGYIVSMRWGWVLVLQACHCTHPQNTNGEEVTGMQVGVEVGGRVCTRHHQ